MAIGMKNTALLLFRLMGHEMYGMLTKLDLKSLIVSAQTRRYSLMARNGINEAATGSYTLLSENGFYSNFNCPAQKPFSALGIRNHFHQSWISKRWKWLDFWSAFQCFRTSGGNGLGAFRVWQCKKPMEKREAGWQWQQRKSIQIASSAPNFLDRPGFVSIQIWFSTLNLDYYDSGH